MGKLAAVVFAGMIAGCSVAAPRVETVTVEVPVPVREVPPDALVACGHERPQFRFYDTSPATGDVLIRKDDQPAFRAWVEDKTRCISAWQEWTK